MSNEIEVKGATKLFDDTRAISNLNFSSVKGINIILGPNGAGKSTLLRCIDGLYKLDNGSVRVRGSDPYVDDKVRKEMSYLSDNYALYDYLDVKSNIIFFGRIYGMKDYEIMEKAKGILAELNATQYINSKIYALSRGTKQKISLCRALINDPQILLLDEPTAFLDANSSDSIRRIMQRFGKEKRTVILVTQKLDEVTRFNCRVSIINKGVIVKDSSTTGLYSTILKDSFVNIRLGKPVGHDIVKKTPGFISSNDKAATMLKIKVDSYKDINKAVEYLIGKNAFIISIDYIEPLIESLSW
jgi:ABC-type multidrug transport system ATPase subunit